MLVFYAFLGVIGLVALLTQSNLNLETYRSDLLNTFIKLDGSENPIQVKLESMMVLLSAWQNHRKAAFIEKIYSLLSPWVVVLTLLAALADLLFDGWFESVEEVVAAILILLVAAVALLALKIKKLG